VATSARRSASVLDAQRMVAFARANAAEHDTPDAERLLIETSFSVVPGAKLIPIECLRPSVDNPRQAPKRELEDLATSIAERGILEPILVRRDPADLERFVVIAGDRRLLAARQAFAASEDPQVRRRLEVLPCIIREVTDRDAFADALLENLARQDLSRAEMMAAVKRLADEYGWSARYIARRTGRSVGDIAELLNVAQHPALAALVREEVLKPTVAGQITRLPDRLQAQAVDAAKAGRMKTVRDVTRFRHDALGGGQLGATKVSDIGHPTPEPRPEVPVAPAPAPVAPTPAPAPLPDANTAPAEIRAAVEALRVLRTRRVHAYGETKRELAALCRWGTEFYG
jgi:ParB/RepB/Spo0J family partition protein